MIAGEGSGKHRIDAQSEALPSGAVDFQIGPLDVLTIDVHRSKDGPEVADFGSSVEVAFSLRTSEYRVALGDVLGLTLQSEPQKEYTFIVRPDGFVTLPRIGINLQVAGKTLTEVTKAATGKYSTSSIRPQLTFELIKSIGDQVEKLSGTYAISRDGGIVLPMLGAVHVSGLSAEQIAKDLETSALKAYGNPVLASAAIVVAAPNTTSMQSADVRRYFRESAKVSADGSVYFPVAGKFQAAGKSLAQLNEEVATNLKAKYSNNVDVYIGLDQSNNMNVFVMGEVRQPGRLTYEPSMTMLQVLATAGWITEGGDLSRVNLIHRTGPGKVLVYTVNLKEVYEGGGHAFQDLRLSPSDMVMVPRTAAASMDLAVDYYIRRMLPFNTSVNYSYINGRTATVP